LGSLMTLKKMCMYLDLMARHCVRTKEAGKLGAATLHILQLLYIGMMHEGPWEGWNNIFNSNSHGTLKPCL